jgi:hypothetical protein
LCDSIEDFFDVADVIFIQTIDAAHVEDEPIGFLKRTVAKRQLLSLLG